MGFFQAPIIKIKPVYVDISFVRAAHNIKQRPPFGGLAPFAEARGGVLGLQTIKFFIYVNTKLINFEALHFWV